MTLGVVYCALSNSFPGRCKIGKTFRSPAKRVSELQAHYRSRYPFYEHDHRLVDYYSRVEWLAHRRLAHCREVSTEMFICTPEEAMAAIDWAITEALRNPPQFQPRPTRAPQRRRRARRGNYGELWIIALTATGIAILGISKPPLPNWLPDSLSRTVFRLESYF